MIKSHDRKPQVKSHTKNLLTYTAKEILHPEMVI